MRVILVNLKLQLPDDAPITPRGLSVEVLDALDVGKDVDATPGLWAAEISTTLAMES